MNLEDLTYSLNLENFKNSLNDIIHHKITTGTGIGVELKEACDLYDTVPYFQFCSPFILLHMLDEKNQQKILNKLLQIQPTNYIREYDEILNSFNSSDTTLIKIIKLVYYFIYIDQLDDIKNIQKDIIDMLIETKLFKDFIAIMSSKKYGEDIVTENILHNVISVTKYYDEFLAYVILLVNVKPDMFPNINDKLREKMVKNARLLWYRMMPLVAAYTFQLNSLTCQKYTKDVEILNNKIEFYQKMIDNKDKTINRLNAEIADLKEQLKTSNPKKENESVTQRILPKDRSIQKEEQKEEQKENNPLVLKETPPFKAIMNKSTWESRKRIRKVGILASINPKKLEKFSKAHSHLKITLYDAFEKRGTMDQILNEDCLIVMTESVPHSVTDSLVEEENLPIIFINRGNGQKLKEAFEYINKLGG